MAQAPYANRPPSYLQTVKDRQAKVNLLSRDVDRYGRTVAEVDREVNLNLGAMVEDGWPLRNRSSWAHCDKGLSSSAEFISQPAPRYGVWKCRAEITRSGPWIPTQLEDHPGSAAIQNPFPAARPLRCERVRLPAMPCPGTAAPGHSFYLDGKRRMGKPAKVCGPLR